jgi:hypothetical protein
MLRLLENIRNCRNVEKIEFLGRPATINGLAIFVFWHPRGRGRIAHQGYQRVTVFTVALFVYNIIIYRLIITTLLRIETRLLQEEHLAENFK